LKYKKPNIIENNPIHLAPSESKNANSNDIEVSNKNREKNNDNHKLESPPLDINSSNNDKNSENKKHSDNNYNSDQNSNIDSILFPVDLHRLEVSLRREVN
jgi:hypothetical protein